MFPFIKTSNALSSILYQRNMIILTNFSYPADLTRMPECMHRHHRCKTSSGFIIISLSIRMAGGILFQKSLQFFRTHAHRLQRHIHKNRMSPGISNRITGSDKRHRLGNYFLIFFHSGKQQRDMQSRSPVHRSHSIPCSGICSHRLLKFSDIFPNARHEI